MYAASFLRGIAAKLADSDRDEAAALANETTLRYERVADSFARLSELFPFPDGGTPHDPGHAATAIGMLDQASAEEEAGVLGLERLCRCLDLVLK
jgi:hypothetical protein